MSSQKFKLAVFVRDQAYCNQIEEYLEKSIKMLDNLEITFLAENEIITEHKSINLSSYMNDIKINLTEKEFYDSLDKKFWKNKKVYKADPRHVGKSISLSWEDQYKLIETCKTIYSKEKFDLIFMGGAAYLFWIVPHLVALEMNLLPYKLFFYDYINPYFKGARVWFCTDPFWDIRTNESFDFNWDISEAKLHIKNLRKSLVEDNFNLDQNALTQSEQYTPKKLKNVIKNLLKLIFKFDYLSKRRLKALFESKKNKKLYTEFSDLPQKFLLFPLNMPYDEQLLLRAPGFENNYKNIEYVLKNLPEDCNLVIKEHPVNPGMLNNKIISKLLEQNLNLFIISPKTPLRDVLSLSNGLITINSTAGLESLNVNKSVLALGMGYYKDLNSVYKTDNKSISSILNDMSAGQNIVNKTEVDLLLIRLLNQTHPGPNKFPDKVEQIYSTMNEALYYKIKQINKITN